jgi:methionyl aminopeptidase
VGKKIVLKSALELEAMRTSCRIAARVRDEVARHISPGVTTAEVAGFAWDLIRGYGAESAFLGYRGYPGAICVSVNETVVHGVPGPRRIELGDIVGVDVGVRYDGFIGDTATTVMVGVTEQRTIQLVKSAEMALQAGIAAARVGNRLSDISHAIESVALSNGFKVVHEYVGHGVGRQMHEEPQIPNFGAPGRGPRLQPGMTLALEPMLNMGAAAVEVLSDGWTVVTQDRRTSAHFEHTVAVGEGEPEVLTA